MIKKGDLVILRKPKTAYIGRYWSEQEESLAGKICIVRDIGHRLCLLTEFGAEKKIDQNSCITKVAYLEPYVSDDEIDEYDTFDVETLLW